MQKVLRKNELPKQLWEARLVANKPVAQNQWMTWVKLENGSLPEFDLGTFCMLSLLDSIDPVVPRPFAIAEAKDGMYGFIYRLTGKFTKALARLPVGSRVGVLGPLGKGFHRDHFKTGKHIFVAGGVGYASVLPFIEECVKQGSKFEVFYGVRTDLECIRKGPMKIQFASDDGSIGFNGRLPQLMEEKIELWRDATWFYICGPTPMMKAVYDILPPQQSFYFLEETMGCGVGICVGCVVSVLGENGHKKNIRSCIEGPIFIGSDLSLWKGELS